MCYEKQKVFRMSGVMAILLLACTVASAQKTLPCKDATLSMDIRVNDLLGRMTPEEKFWQMFMIPGDNAAPGQDQQGIFGLQVSAGASAQRDPITLRVLTYNIYHGEAADGSVNLDLLASIIKETKPDLVALQEVDKNTQRTGGIDITEELAHRTGLKGYFVKHRDFQGGEYGNAILSRFPVTDIDVIEGYHSTPSIITFALATVELAPDADIVFGCAHLTTRAEDRTEQARQLRDYYVNNISRAPMILAGDFNAEPHHDEIKMLLTEFADCDAAYANTFNARTGPVKKIDYILYPRTSAWAVQEARVLCRQEASDHCAVFAVLKYGVR